MRCSSNLSLQPPAQPHCPSVGLHVSLSHLSTADLPRPVLHYCSTPHGASAPQRCRRMARLAGGRSDWTRSTLTKIRTTTRNLLCSMTMRRRRRMRTTRVMTGHSLLSTRIGNPMCRHWQMITLISTRCARQYPPHHNYFHHCHRPTGSSSRRHVGPRRRQAQCTLPTEYPIQSTPGVPVRCRTTPASPNGRSGSRDIPKVTMSTIRTVPIIIIMMPAELPLPWARPLANRPVVPAALLVLDLDLDLDLVRLPLLLVVVVVVVV